MEKVTEDTMFDFYTSDKAISEGRGKNKVNGIIYVERIRSGRKPFLRKMYNDLKVVLTAKQSEYTIEKFK